MSVNERIDKLEKAVRFIAHEDMDREEAIGKILDPPAPEPSAFEKCKAEWISYGCAASRWTNEEWANVSDIFRYAQANERKSRNAALDQKIIERIGSGCSIDLIVAVKDESGVRKKVLEEAAAWLRANLSADLCDGNGDGIVPEMLKDLIDQEPDDGKG